MMYTDTDNNAAVTMTITRSNLNDLILACGILDHASDDDVLKWAELQGMLLRILMQHDLLQVIT